MTIRKMPIVPCQEGNHIELGNSVVPFCPSEWLFACSEKKVALQIVRPTKPFFLRNRSLVIFPHLSDVFCSCSAPFPSQFHPNIVRHFPAVF
jgi:hypothetical protein